VLLRLLFLSIVSLSFAYSIGQTRIDGNFAFQTDPAKKYSIYIPSNYVAGTPHKMMLGLHPFNTSRWDGESWCDTLIGFAEMNGLLLVCPDGGADGKIDDAIDTAFTTAIIDSMELWYDIDPAKKYVMGFSWGGKTTYTYGLLRAGEFGGFLPIGAAISGTSEVNTTLQQNAAGKPVYIIHGSSDSPGSRFYPVRDSLISKGAIVETNLLAGVGHTVDFSNRDAILTAGFQWIDSVNCLVPNSVDISNKVQFNSYPNPIAAGSNLKIEGVTSLDEIEVLMWNIAGATVFRSNVLVEDGTFSFSLPVDLPKGSYFLTAHVNKAVVGSQQIIVE